MIGCAAGFPATEQGLQNKFDYFGIVGDRDFNLPEMEQWDANLKQNGFTHQLLATSGTHGWASTTDFETALLWMQVNAMKEHLQEKNDKLLTAFTNTYTKRINAEKASGDWIKAHELLDGLVRTLEGLQDASAYKKQLAEMNANTDFNLATSMHSSLKGIELSLQKALASQFTTQDEKWWTNKIAELNQNSHKQGAVLASQMNGRLLAYLGFVAYMNTDEALKRGDLENAMRCLIIFKMADPKNPDCSYLAAVLYMQKLNPQMALVSLKEAVSLGYNDVLQLLTNPLFNNLKSDADFAKIVSGAKGNNTVK